MYSPGEPINLEDDQFTTTIQVRQEGKMVEKTLVIDPHGGGMIMGKPTKPVESQFEQRSAA